MPKKDRLTELIESLDQNEKRYFSLFTSMSAGEKNYTRLYQLIESGVTDDETLRARLSGRNINLSYEKRYLMRQLLKALGNYYHDSSDEILFHNRLIEIELLFNKRLLRPCLEVIRQSQKEAARLELELIVMELRRWEYKCLIGMGEYEEGWAQVRKHKAEEANEIEIIRNRSAYREMQLEIQYLSNSTGAGQPQAFAKFLEHPLLQSPASAKCFSARLMYYDLKGLVYHMAEDTVMCAKMCREGVRLFEDDPDKVRQYPQSYFAALANYFTRCALSDNLEEEERVLHLIEKIPEIKGINISVKLRFDIRMSVHEKKFILAAQRHQYEEGRLYFEQHINGPKGKMEQFPVRTRILVSFYGALCYFYTGHHDRALLLLRGMIDGYFDQARADYFIHAQVLQIMIHYDTGQTGLLPYLCKSLQRYVTKKKITARALPLFINTINQLIKLKSQSAGLRAFAVKRQAEFVELMKGENEVWVQTPDLVYWLGIKTNGRRTH